MALDLHDNIPTHPGVAAQKTAHERLIVPKSQDASTAGFPLGYARPINAVTHVRLDSATATDGANSGGTLQGTVVQAGAPGTAGTLRVYPATTASGKLDIEIADQSGDTEVSLNIGAMAAARVITLRDPGAAASILTTTDSTAAATTATAAEITQHCDESANTEVVTTTNVIAATESGKTFFLDLAAGFVSTLPAVAAGLRFTFIVKTAPSGGGNYTIVGASGTPIVGHVVSSQDAGGNGDSETSGVLTITLVDSKAVKGDRVDLFCDGTNWYASCKCKTFDAITLS